MMWHTFNCALAKPVVASRTTLRAFYCVGLRFLCECRLKSPNAACEGGKQTPWVTTRIVIGPVVLNHHHHRRRRRRRHFILLQAYLPGIADGKHAT